MTFSGIFCGCVWKFFFEITDLSLLTLFDLKNMSSDNFGHEKVSWFLTKFFRLVWIWISRHVFCLQFLKLVQKSQNYIICKVHISFQIFFSFYQVRNRVFFLSLFCEFWGIVRNRLKSIYHFSQPYQNRILKSVVFNFVTW